MNEAEKEKEKREVRKRKESGNAFIYSVLHNCNSLDFMKAFSGASMRKEKP